MSFEFINKAEYGSSFLVDIFIDYKFQRIGESSFMYSMVHQR